METKNVNATEVKEVVVTDPNKRFSVPKRAYAFDVDDGIWKGHTIDYFFEKYNHENGYEGLNLGDYVTIGEYDWMVAGFDYFQDIYGPGIVFIPKINLGAMIMNTTNVSFGGYSNSFMDSYLKLMLKDMNFARISDHIVKDHDGKPYIRLMSDIQVYGKTIDFGRAEDDKWSDVAYERSVADHSQILPIFNYIGPFEYSDEVPEDRSWLNPDPEGFWLSTVVNTGSFAYATTDGDGVDWDYPTASHGLRPLMYLNRFV